MAENEMLPEDVESDETDEYGEIFTLTDEDGKEEQFELIGSTDVDGKTYYAMTSVETDSDEYVILRVVETDGEITLTTVDDDEEFDRVADVFDDELFSEIDYDADAEDGEDAEEKEDK